MDSEKEQFDLKIMAEKWPGGVMARFEIGKFTGGMISPGHLANLDSQGKGPPGAFRMNGRRVGYVVPKFLEWFQTE